MDDTTLKLQIRSVNVPEGLPHLPRHLEIEDLVKYLEVQPLVAPGLALVSMGEEEPGQDRAEFPWVKLNAQGEPLGWFVNVGGTWEPISEKFFVRSLIADMVEEQGNVTVPLNAGDDVVQAHPDIIEFYEDYDEIPDIQLSIVGGTVLTSGTGADSGFYTHIVPVDITVSGFKLKAMTSFDTAVAARTLEVFWVARGPRKDLS